jgi:hypothetical protein
MRVNQFARLVLPIRSRTAASYRGEKRSASADCLRTLRTNCHCTVTSACVSPVFFGSVRSWTPSRGVEPSCFLSGVRISADQSGTRI